MCDKQFWILDKKEHIKTDIVTNGACCFNHLIGLPTKVEKIKPLFDYGKILFYALEENKHVWIKKATGLVITEFMLRYMSWLCLRNDKLQNPQMCIVTGPHIELAITLINRMKGLFEDKIKFDSRI